MLRTRGTTDKHGWILIAEEIMVPEIKPQVRAALAETDFVGDTGCPFIFSKSVFISSSVVLPPLRICANCRSFRCT